MATHRQTPHPKGPMTSRMKSMLTAAAIEALALLIIAAVLLR